MRFLNTGNMDTAAKAFCGALAAVCTAVFGGADIWLKALLAVIALDYATGVMGAFAKGRLDSRAGFRGICKKMMILCVVALAARMDMVLGATGALRGLAIGFYIANDSLSVLENAVDMGVPVPRGLVERLEQMKEQQTEKKGEG